MGGLDGCGDGRCYSEGGVISKSRRDDGSLGLTVLQNAIDHFALDLRVRIPVSQQLQEVLVLCDPVHGSEDKDRVGRVRLLREVVSGERDGRHGAGMSVCVCDRGEAAQPPGDIGLPFPLRNPKDEGQMTNHLRHALRPTQKGGGRRDSCPP